MIYVTGDVHGGFDMDKLRELDGCAGLPAVVPEGAAGSPAGDGRDAPRLTEVPTPGAGDYLIVCGDFGFPWDFSDEECADIGWLESRPYTVLFVDGNHECFGHWAERPMESWHGGLVQRLADGSPIRRLARGEVFLLDGARIFTMGGATSVDRAWRTPYFDWWPQELPDEENFEQARAKLDEQGWDVDYVITHTCANSMLPHALYPDRGWHAPGQDRLTTFFEELEARLSYRHWYFGHFHRDRAIDARHTVLYQAVVPLGATVVEERGA